MNILNCFKIVPDLEMLSDEDWKTDEDLQIDVSFVKSKWNCFDESALEMMLKLSDLSEGFNVIFHFHAMTIGNAKCDNYLKTLYALGFEKAIRINQEIDQKFRPDLISDGIANFCKKDNNYDAIVMGNQSEDGENGKSPFLVAEKLGWPCFSQVINLEPVDETSLKLVSNSDHGLLTQVVKTPFVITIGDSPNSYLRVPTLKERMRVSKQPIEVLEGNDFIRHSKDNIELVGLKNIDYTREGKVIQGTDAAQLAEILFETNLKGWL